MGMKFRKSVKLAPGVKLNIGKKSVGVSFGNKYGGISMNSRTGTKARVSAPGTGLSYTTKVGNSKSSGLSNASSTTAHDDIAPTKNKTVALLLAVFLGPLGAHRFYVGKMGTGILWLFSGGVFGIGWIVDIVNIIRGSFSRSIV